MHPEADNIVTQPTKMTLPVEETTPVPKRTSLPAKVNRAMDTTVTTPIRSSIGSSGHDDHTLRPRPASQGKSNVKKSPTVEVVTKQQGSASELREGEGASSSGRKRPVASSRPHSSSATNKATAATSSSSGCSLPKPRPLSGTAHVSKADVSAAGRMAIEGSGSDGQATEMGKASEEGVARIAERRGRDSDLSGKETAENSLEKESAFNAPGSQQKLVARRFHSSCIRC